MAGCRALGERGKGLRVNERTVAVHDQRHAILRQRGQRDANGVPRPARRVLRYEHDVWRGHLGANDLAAMTDDDAKCAWPERANGIEHVRHQRSPGQRMQHLRARRAHALALTGGHHDDLQRLRSHEEGEAKRRSGDGLT